MITKLLILICCLGVSRAGVLGTDYSDASLVSYSKISTGLIATQAVPIGNVHIPVPKYILSNPKPQDKNQLLTVKTPVNVEVKKVPLYTEAIVDNNRPPLRSRFDLSVPEPTTVPLSIKVTPGLSAYASDIEPYDLEGKSYYKEDGSFK